MAIKKEPASTTKAARKGSQSDVNAAANSARSGLALLALLLAFVGLLIQFWFWNSQDLSQLTEDLNSSRLSARTQQANTQALNTKIDDFSLRLDALENRQAPPKAIDYSAQIAALQQNTTRLTRQSASLQARLAEQAAIKQNGDRHLARAEVEYLLRLANERLQLFGDRRAALATYRLAERQLAAMGDPLMLAVRQQLQLDIRAVADIQVMDPVIVLAGLQDLEVSMPGWPLKQEAELSQEPAEMSDPGLWAKVKSTMGSLVSIRKQDEPVLSLDEIDWLQERIRTQFQVIRIASLNGNQELFRSALKTVLQLQADYYQPNHPVNIDVRRSLQQLLSTKLRPELPDVTRALREIQYLGNPVDSGLVEEAPVLGSGAEVDVIDSDTSQ